MRTLIPNLSKHPFTKHQNKIGNTSKKITQTVPKFQTLVSILEPFAWHFRLVAHLFRDLFFGTYGGYPLESILAFPGARSLGPILSTFWKISVAHFAPKFKDSRATNGTNHTFRQKQVRIQTNTADQSSICTYGWTSANPPTPACEQTEVSVFSAFSSACCRLSPKF